MNALNKYRELIFTIFTAIMYFVWNYVDLFNSEKWYVITIFPVITSYGTYKLLLKLVELLANNCQSFKKLVFASEYLEGMWIGCFIGKDGNPQYFVETFEQDFNGLIIRGRNYYKNGSFKGTWVSEKVSINAEKGELSYTYITDMINNTYSNRGFGDFSFIRKSPNKAPNKLIGFTTDLFNNKKCFAIEERVEIENILDDNEIVAKAISIYEKNKDLFLKNEPWRRY